MFKSLLSRGFFFKSLLCLILFLYLNFVQIKPAFAVSTYDSCMRNPTCAKAFIAETGAKAVLKESAGTAVKQTVTKSTINLTKGKISNTTISTLGKRVTLFGSGAYLLDKVFGHLIDDGIDVIQDKIYDYFSNSADSDIPCTYRVFYENSRGEKIMFYTTPLNVKPSEYSERLEDVDPTRGSYNIYLYHNGNFAHAHYIHRDGYNGLHFEKADFCGSFDDLTDEQKDIAIDKYFDENSEEAFRDLIDTTKVEFPEFEPGDEIFIDDGEGGYRETVPDGESNDNSGGDITEEECKANGDNYSLDENGDCVEQPPQEEDEETECIECKELKYTNKNFFVYAQEKFITEPKFPFDIFGNIPSGSASNRCPTVSMYGRSKEMCFVPDAIGMLKYPVWISWMFRLVLSI